MVQNIVTFTSLLWFCLFKISRLYEADSRSVFMRAAMFLPERTNSNVPYSQIENFTHFLFKCVCGIKTWNWSFRYIIQSRSQNQNMCEYTNLWTGNVSGYDWRENSLKVTLRALSFRGKCGFKLLQQSMLLNLTQLDFSEMFWWELFTGQTISENYSDPKSVFCLFRFELRFSSSDRGASKTCFGG